MAQTEDVVVVGAGPAGLAVAACLAARGVRATVLERAPALGQSWRDRYERLHLHTPRHQSKLPGLRIPREYGQFVSRADFVRYLDSYAGHHGVEPRTGVEVARVDREGDRWRVDTSDGVLHARYVVVATGYNDIPFTPDWPGLDEFRGEFLHAADYRLPDSWVGRDVLVVGTGNTGAEIAADLAESGARNVWLAVRTPPNIVPRQLGPLPVTVMAPLSPFLPRRMADAMGGLMYRVQFRDLRDRGLEPPSQGAVTRWAETDAIPIIDVGMVEQLRAGRITPVGAVASFTESSVALTDGAELTPDAVIAATGYRSGLDKLVGHLGILADDGRPTRLGADTHDQAPNLHFVGLVNPFSALLRTINRQAKAAARAIAADSSSDAT